MRSHRQQFPSIVRQYREKSSGTSLRNREPTRSFPETPPTPLCPLCLCGENSSQKFL
ncbi:hypothetical protein CKA32_006703 [Geitlerinema sp. FC II]|nr:hypothetical protein CKA32_006703 [Geitlerinema sp. FC II]